MEGCEGMLRKRERERERFPRSDAITKSPVWCSRNMTLMFSAKLDRVKTYLYCLGLMMYRTHCVHTIIQSLPPNPSL